MSSPDKVAFNQAWPRAFIIFLAVIELISALFLIATELGNVAANFWTTNVFAGGWCGIIMLIHFIAVSVAGCCSPGPSAAFRAVVITILALVACATLISFDAVFIAQPTTCLLTPSCSNNSLSTTVFTYTFQQNFYATFLNINPFTGYSQKQTKFLFQTIQLGVGCLCFVLCLVYLVVYYVTKNKAGQRVAPSQPSYYAPQPAYQQQGYSSRQAPRVPQPPPGEIPWSTNRRY